jgi:hypothetical protein
VTRPVPSGPLNLTPGHPVAVQVEPSGDYQYIAAAHGDTVYYGDSTVSQSAHTGTLTTGQSVTLASTTWFTVSTALLNGQPANASVFVTAVPLLADSGNLTANQSLRVVREAPLNVRWPEYSAAGDGVADDTTALQTALAALPTGGVARGGSILLPRGRYQVSSQLVAKDSYGVRFVGEAGQGTGYTEQGACLRFTGGGSGSFIDARSSQGFTLENLEVEYTSGSYTGNLIDFGHSLSGNDATYGTIKGCTLHGVGVATAKSLVSLRLAILCDIIDSHLSWAQAGVRMMEDNGAGGVDYSNAHTIRGGTIDNVINGLMNPGQGLNVMGTRFEGTNGGMGGLQSVLSDDITSFEFGYGINLDGCWCGDAIAVTNWIKFVKITPRGLSVKACEFLGGSKGIVFAKGASGVNITANSFGVTNAVDLGSSGVGICSGVDISGNDFSGVSGTPVLNTSGHHGIRVEGNSPRNGENQPEDLVMVAGHLQTDQARGLVPTITVDTAQAGSGATGSLGGGSNDIAGTITINCGTGTNAGHLANVTFAAAYDSAPASSAARPRVLLQPRTDAAVACGPTTQGGDNTAFSIYARTAPTVSTPLVFDYFVIQ